MNSRILIAAMLWIWLSDAALADGKIWSWVFIAPTPEPRSKNAWFTDQGTAKDESMGKSFDIRIGGAATNVAPNHLDLYELKGTIHGNSVVASLVGLETDEQSEPYTGKFATGSRVDHISLVSRRGATILLYAPAEKSN